MRRKRYYLMLSMLLFAGLSSQAQGWLATTALPGDIENTIIREYQTDFSISYIKTTAGCYFAWSDNQSAIELVEIDCEYDVRDFEILEDTVCFCGQYGGYGLVGWFSIPDLFWGNDIFHVFHNQFSTQAYHVHEVTPTNSYVAVFNDLTFFEEKENPDGWIHIALVGETEEDESCVAELTGFFGPNSWNYTTGATDPGCGTLEQVVETDNYIVAAGVSGSGPSTAIRVFNKSAMLSSTPLLGDYIYCYTSSTVILNCRYPLDDFRMTHTNGDTVATLSLFEDTNYPNSDGFVTHLIDAAATIYASIGSPCADSWMIYINNIVKHPMVKSITYSQQKNTLAGLVQSANPLTTNSTLMGEQHVPFFASMDYYSIAHYSFLNHDRFFGQSGYVAMGRNELIPSELAICARFLGTTSITSCGLGASAPTVRNSFALKKDHAPLTMLTKPFTFDDLPPLSVFDPGLSIICTEP